MKVGFHPAWPAAFLVIGIVSTVLGLLLTVNGEFTPSVILGPLLVILGLLQLTRPYFEFDPRSGTVSVKAMVGSITRRFGGSEGGRLALEGNRVVSVHPDGSRKKVPVQRYLARQGEWNAFVAQLTAR